MSGDGGTPAVRVLVELRRDGGGRIGARVQGLDPRRDCGEVDLDDLSLLLEAVLEDAGHRPDAARHDPPS